MTLTDRIVALAQAVGADIKARSTFIFRSRADFEAADASIPVGARIVHAYEKLPTGSEVTSFIPFDTDLSDAMGNVWTASGAASFEAGAGRFGGGALHINGGHLRSPSVVGGVGLIPTTGPFTLEFFVKAISPRKSGYQCLVRHATTQETWGAGSVEVWWDRSDWSGMIGFYAYDASPSVVRVTGSSYGNWRHICYMSDGSTLRGFADGVLMASQSLLAIKAAAPIFIGLTTSSNLINAYFDDFRITKAAIYNPDGFAPPDEPLSLDGTLITGEFIRTEDGDIPIDSRYSSHRLLADREYEDAHPIEAITGLRGELGVAVKFAAVNAATGGVIIDTGLSETYLSPRQGLFTLRYVHTVAGAAKTMWTASVQIYGAGTRAALVFSGNRTPAVYVYADADDGRIKLWIPSSENDGVGTFPTIDASFQSAMSGEAFVHHPITVTSTDTPPAATLQPVAVLTAQT
jgi:hypothetical protein